MFQSSSSPANAPLPPPPSKYVSKNSVMRMNYVQPRQQTHVSNTQRRRSCRCCQKETATHTNDDNTGEYVHGGVDHYNPDVNGTPDNELGGTYDPNAGAGATQQCHTDSSSCIGQGVPGCTLISNSNICCTDGGDGSGCTNIEKACMIDATGKELCRRTIQGCSGEAPPSSSWEDAYFFSGGISGAYTQNNIGSNETLLTNNLPNGSDSSCGESDKLTFSACVTGIGTSDDCSGLASGCYGITHTGDPDTGYYSKASSMCLSSESISLVNPGGAGKVAAIEHGPFGTPLTGVLCSTKRWDKSLSDYNCTNWPHYTNNCSKFDEITRQLHSITTNCGKNKYTFTHTNPNVTRSCLIYAKHIYNIWPKPFFEDGGNPITTAGLNDISAGVAISWGHGVLDGGCGAITFMQQGKQRGSMNHDNPGHTNLHLQIGTRAWSGEWSDSALVNASGNVEEWGNQSGYLRAGSNTDHAEANSQSCLQPIITRVELKDFKALLNTICSDICGNCGLTGCCTPAGEATNSACYGVGKSDCLARSLKEGKCSDRDDTWCCKWTDGSGDGGTIKQACPSGNHIEQTCAKVGTSCEDVSSCNSGLPDTSWCGSCNNGICQKSICLAPYASCDGANPNEDQCCVSNNVFKCTPPAHTDPDPSTNLYPPSSYRCYPAAASGGFIGDYSKHPCCCKPATGTDSGFHTCAAACDNQPNAVACKSITT
jgi:hypothetical protein